jgi:hypothetical protein
MARTSNPLIGKSRNKIGGVVMSTWKGINVLREKPATVANPNTPAQQAQRSIMRQLVAAARAILSTLHVSFRQEAVEQSQYNAFIHANAPQAFSVSGAVATFIAANLVTAKGTLIPPEDLAAVVDTGRVYDLTWTDNTGDSGANASDVFTAVVVNAAGTTIKTIQTAATRSDAGTSVTIPGAWSLTGARLTGFFSTVAQDQSSDSVNVAL